MLSHTLLSQIAGQPHPTRMRSRRLLAALLLVVLPASAQAQEIVPAPPAQSSALPEPPKLFAVPQPGPLVSADEEPVQAREGRPVAVDLTIAGAVLFGGGYLLNLLWGSAAGYDTTWGYSGHDPEWHEVRQFSLVPLVGPWLQMSQLPIGFDQGYWGALLLIEGLIQGAGFILLAAAVGKAVDDASVEVAPMAGRDTAGLVVRGAF